MIEWLTIPEAMEAWKADYQKMVEQMIYEPSPPSFEEIIRDLEALKDQINRLPWSLKKEYPLPG